MRRSEPPVDLRGRAMRTAEFVERGVARSRLQHADVARPHRGVAAFELPHQSILDRCAAYEPVMLPGQFFSHATAAALWGLRLPWAGAGLAAGAGAGAKASAGANPRTSAGADVGASLDVAVLDPRTPPRRPGIVGHRVSSVSLARVHGFAVVSAADAWCQLGATLSRDDLVAAGDSALPTSRRSGVATLEDLVDAATRHRCTVGAPRVAAALALVRPGVESRPESLLRLALRRARLPEPAVAVAVRLGDGRTYHPDLSYPGLRIAIEYDGDGHRTDRRQWEWDVERYERFADAGWRVVRVTATQLFTNPAEIAFRVRRALRAARASTGVGSGAGVGPPGGAL